MRSSGKRPLQREPMQRKVAKGRAPMPDRSRKKQPFPRTAEGILKNLGVRPSAIADLGYSEIRNGIIAMGEKAGLSERYLGIIDMRLGGMTQVEIANAQHVTPQRIQGIERTALFRIRKAIVASLGPEKAARLLENSLLRRK